MATLPGKIKIRCLANMYVNKLSRQQKSQFRLPHLNLSAAPNEGISNIRGPFRPLRAITRENSSARLLGNWTNSCLHPTCSQFSLSPPFSLKDRRFTA